MSALLRTTALALLLGWVASAEAAFTLTAEADRRTLEAGESFNLSIIARGDRLPDAPPDFAAALAAHFDILAQRSLNNIRLVNGARDVERTWRFELEPRASAGRFTIPSFNWQGQRSAPIVIEVRAPPAPRTPKPKASKSKPAAGSPAPKPAPSPAPTPPPAIFMEATIDRDRLPVRAQFIYTLRVFTVARLRGNVDELKLPNHTPVRKILEVNYNKRLNGRNYTVHEWRYACFPQKSGKLRIPSLKLVGQRLDQRKRVRKNSKALEVEVLPIPASLSADAWLPTDDLKLEEEWSAEPEDGWEVGKPLTRVIKLHARGLLAEQLPAMTLEDMSGLKLYPEQPQLKNSNSRDGVRGLRRETTVLIPTRPSVIELPEIRIPWWDLKADRLRYATLPARRLNVTAGIGESQLLLDDLSDAQGGIVTDAGEIDPSILTARDEPAADAAGVSWLPWWLLGAACAGWALFAALWWRQRRHLMTPDPAAAATARRDADVRALLAKAEQACKDNDPAAARRALMRWSAARWRDDSPPSNLLETAHRIGSPALARAVDNLNRHCYRDERRQWDGTLLLEAIRGLPKTIAANTRRTSLRPALPELYS